ncbi:glycosyltransferase family 4 protein [Niveibacterium sp. SC-1]|uniref:glycosyltransferase family 4 protein n=1 Tax=Niveibacterium sp. SC-1 TaxID=3135646 RepID=UPI00311E4F1F
MKILYHHRTASRDGQAVHIDELIASLRARGHEVRVVAPAVADPDSMGGKVSWVHRLKRHAPKAIYELMELAYSFVAYRRLMDEAGRFQPDVLYERYNLFLLAGVALRKRLGLPLLLEVNAPLVHERTRYGGLSLKRLARWAEGKTWRSADVVLPVTRVLASHVEAAGAAPSRIRVIPNGINRAHFGHAKSMAEAKRALRLEEKLVLGFTGFVRDWHGVDRVLRWMAGADAPRNAFLLIVGDGPARAELEALADELGLQEHLRFTGVVDRAVVPDHVAAFDIALQPAVVPYASPLKLMEYLVLAKAIVAPREPNLLEVLDADRNALLFDGRDPEGLAQALSRLCADPALRERLGRGAEETIERLGLTWDSNAARVEALAQACLQRNAVAEPLPASVR